MKLVQLGNHRENKQTVQKRHKQYNRCCVFTDNHAGTEVTFTRFAQSYLPAPRQGVSIGIVLVENSEGSSSTADYIPSSPVFGLCSRQFPARSGISPIS
jgi:hypothetical protein